VKRALITGISGQDGRHLAQLLVGKSYEVFGMIRDASQEDSLSQLSGLEDVKFLEGDLTDKLSLTEILERAQPDEIYNLGAFSSVGKSFLFPESTADVTGIGVLRLLQAIRETNLHNTVRIYQASSSEMFGNVQDIPQTESTYFRPRSPYGVAKAFSHQTCANYRQDYGLHVSCGILFNHEGPYRSPEYVTRKITQTAARIKLGKVKKLTLGDISAQRDWGYAGDYVNAMWLMLQQRIPDDYVIATGQSHSVSDLIQLAFRYAEIEKPPTEYLLHDRGIIRPNDTKHLVGDFSKAKERLGWEPKISFEELIKIMVENDIQLEGSLD